MWNYETDGWTLEVATDRKGKLSRSPSVFCFAKSTSLPEGGKGIGKPFRLWFPSLSRSGNFTDRRGRRSLQDHSSSLWRIPYRSANGLHARQSRDSMPPMVDSIQSFGLIRYVFVWAARMGKKASHRIYGRGNPSPTELFIIHHSSFLLLPPTRYTIFDDLGDGEADLIVKNTNFPNMNSAQWQKIYS